MEDRLAKIRDYVLANKKHNKYRADVDRSSSSQGAYEEDERILAFIDSLKKEPICAYSTERYTDEDRKVLCEGCEEECKFAKKKELVTSVWHDASETPKMYCKYLTRYADGRVNGSWERHNDGFIPWKDVVKEHKFTHWCYVEDLLKL